MNGGGVEAMLGPRLATTFDIALRQTRWRWSALDSSSRISAAQRGFRVGPVIVGKFPSDNWERWWAVVAGRENFDAGGVCRTGQVGDGSPAWHGRRNRTGSGGAGKKLEMRPRRDEAPYPAAVGFVDQRLLD